jgi:hypothetical protein
VTVVEKTAAEVSADETGAASNTNKHGQTKVYSMIRCL